MKIDERRYRQGLQCPKRLWLSAVERRSYPRAAIPDRSELLRELRLGARALFPDPAVRFDQTLEYEGVEARIDVLEPLPEGGVGLRQVRATSRVRDTDLDALVLPFFVLRGLGHDLRSAEVVCIDPEYVRRGEIDWSRLLTRSDVTRDLEFLVSDVRAELERMRDLLSRTRAPEVSTSPHCLRPRRCGYFDHCSAGRPDAWILRLPGLRPDQYFALDEAGVSGMAEIPDGFALERRQQLACRANRVAGLVVEPELARRLDGSGPPCLYLDFETWNPAIPFLDGTRPHQRIPCQWSLHRLGPDGLEHEDFLLAEGLDPRRRFAETLCEALGPDSSPILVYSSFESEVLGELGGVLPDLAAPLERARRRLFDLLPVVRSCVYHPGFVGSYSLKRVSGALCADFGYEDLGAIRNGAQAADALGRLMSGGLSEPDVAGTREALRRYCQRDTQALVELHAVLRRASLPGSDGGSSLDGSGPQSPG